MIQTLKKTSIKKQFDSGKVWGIAMGLDLFNCNYETITSKEKIEQFIIELCVLIDMKRYGDPLIVHFGREEKVEGFTAVQLIETSNITAHFANYSKAVYFDLFSCKEYDPEEVEAFAKSFFGANASQKHVNFRMSQPG